MGRLRLHPISIPLRELIGLMIVILLLVASAQALPKSNYSWTEAPWVSDEAGEDEKMATELSAPLAFNLLEGYHLLRLRAEEEGRYFMTAARKSEPGNALILDLVAKSDNASVSPLDVRTIPTGRAMVTIESERIKGYDVYLDGVFYSSDVGDGSIDGVASFTLRADKTHTISISQRDVQGNIINKSEHTKRFKRDMAYALLIE
ncbi:hypothetical protein [Methanothrix sp.]|uniref:hypothetical protein n=1 Tax=Methanothrix sp. TaxID=90426 RepID=UPI003299BACE